MPVCIVDDDLSARESVRGLLRSAGMVVEAYASAGEFLARAPNVPPSCLILDIDLPGQNGLELQQELARLAIDVPIIFLTGHGDIPKSVRAIKAGAVEFFTKPFDAEQLLDAIRTGVAARLAAKTQPDSIGFGPFRLVPSQQMLLEADVPCRLGSRAFDILLALLEHAGELVTREELFARAWPDTVVDEANLRVHIGALRKVLGDGTHGRRYVVNVPGRGYTFVEPVTRHTSTPPLPEPVEATTPTRRSTMIGRHQSVAKVAEQLGTSGFVSIVGAGGCGKTTLAHAVADARAAGYEHGVRFVELTDTHDSDGVMRALAAAVGLDQARAPVGELSVAVVAHLRGKRMLVVIDTCEHVVEAAAALAEMLVALPGIHVLATSRERLRALGELVHQLGGLRAPAESEPIDARSATTYSAIELFVQCAGASSDRFQLREQDVPVIAEICRRLDGCPLAIELAAARAQLLGLCSLLDSLDDRLDLFTNGRRTALARHRSLRATLDWTYATLTPNERIVLQRLSTLPPVFTLDAAMAVMANGGGAPHGTLGRLPALAAWAGLAAKSLLHTDASGEAARHHLGSTTRLYASQQEGAT